MEDCYANMTVGFGRSQLRETPELQLQFLDLDTVDETSVNVLAEAFVRFYLASSWNLRASHLWSIEPELVLEKGQYLLTRVVENQHQNGRYNSSRRPIYEELDPKISNLHVVDDEGSLGLQAGFLTSSEHNLTGDFVTVHTKFSTRSTIRLASMSSLFVIQGIEPTFGSQVICLSKSQASTVQAFGKWCFPVEILLGQETQVLSCLVSNLLAISALEMVPFEGVVLVHDATPLFAIVLKRRASEKGVRVKFTFALVGTRSNSQGHIIHHRASAREMKAALAKDICLFIDFSRTTESWRAASSIRKILPDHCQYESTKSMFLSESRIFGSKPTLIHDCLMRAKEATERDLLEVREHNEIKIVDLAGIKKDNTVDSFIEWKCDGKIQVQINPVDSSPLFKSQKTYWLVGLTQTLGLLLCEWMINRGARYIVLSSRAPKVVQAWLKKMSGLGATVKYFASEVTSKKDTQNLYRKICESLPAIAGVAHGAMVLRDILTKHMDLDNLSAVTRPKVDGSTHLNAIFCRNDLDFFVFFSSMAGIVGNIG